MNEGQVTMTDKQIIIDGIDVSGCEYYCERHCKQVVDEDGCYVFLCADDKYCHYKKWQRKEQECEELKDLNTRLDNQREAYWKEYQKLKQTLTEIKEYLKPYLFRGGVEPQWVEWQMAQREKEKMAKDIFQILQKISEVEDG